MANRVKAGRAYVNIDPAKLEPLERVYSLDDARSWFLCHAEGEILCVIGNVEMLCKTYGEAERFFQDYAD